MPGASKWLPSLRFSHQNPVCTSPLPHTCYMSCPSESSTTGSLCQNSSVNWQYFAVSWAATNEIFLTKLEIRRLFLEFTGSVPSTTPVCLPYLSWLSSVTPCRYRDSSSQQKRHYFSQSLPNSSLVYQGAHKSLAPSHHGQKLLRYLLIIVNPQYGTWIMSPVWRLEFWGGVQIFRKIYTLFRINFYAFHCYVIHLSVLPCKNWRFVRE